MFATAFQLCGCNGRTDDLFQLIEYSEMLANEFMTWIVSCNEIRGFCKNSNMSSA